jgi:hypothetical protein
VLLFLLPLVYVDTHRDDENDALHRIRVHMGEHRVGSVPRVASSFSFIFIPRVGSVHDPCLYIVLFIVQVLSNHSNVGLKKHPNLLN